MVKTIFCYLVPNLSYKGGSLFQLNVDRLYHLTLLNHLHHSLKYIHPEKVFCFLLITSVKLKGTCHETYRMIAKVDSVLVKFGGVW